MRCDRAVLTCRVPFHALYHRVLPLRSIRRPHHATDNHYGRHARAAFEAARYEERPSVHVAPSSRLEESWQMTL